MEVQRYAREARDVILIGHAGHPEVEGTMGRFDASFGGHIHLVEKRRGRRRSCEVRDPERLAFVTQTTLSVDDTAEIVDALRKRFPTLATPRKEDICYATQNRQDAVKKLLEQCDVLLVVGSRTSSNSNRLRELADRAGVPGYLVDGPDDLRREWFAGKNAVGVTAGASAPELLVQQVVEKLRTLGRRGAARGRRAAKRTSSSRCRATSVERTKAAGGRSQAWPRWLATKRDVRVSCPGRAGTGRNREYRPMIKFLLWLLLFVLCWPLALLALVLWPIVWLISIPFRLLGIALTGVFEFLKAILFLPARLLGGKPG